MTQLKPDCLMFQTTDGERVPCSAEWVSFELIGESATLVDPELVRHAAAAVLHYFKHELHRSFVSVAEFASALERALRGLGLSIFADSQPEFLRVQESHLPDLIQNAGLLPPPPAAPAATGAVPSNRPLQRPAALRQTTGGGRSLEPPLRASERPNRGLPPHLLPGGHPQPVLHPAGAVRNRA